MSNQMTLNEKRRIDSDKRIIKSAIKSFGQLGYTHSNIRDIARGAGITSGLITQRYGTKELLFEAAYKNAIEGVFSEMNINASPRECLYTIIEDIERLNHEDPDVFEFFYMLHNATDYPKEILRPHQEQMKKEASYVILKNAQKNGMLPAGNLDELLAAFGAMVFHNVRLCQRYHLEHLEPEKILSAIHFTDRLSENKTKWFRVIETAIANTFDFLIYINIRNNKGDVLNKSDLFAVCEDFTDARQDIELIIQEKVCEEEQQMVRAFMNLDSLSDRLKGRKSVSCKSRQKDGAVLVYSILPVSWDENEKLIEIFIGVYQSEQEALTQ